MPREVTVSQGGSAWWSDALNDPWRNPDADAVVVSRTPAPPPPAEPVLDGALADRRTGLRLVAVVALVVGLLAGALGGAVGYLAANRRPATVVLGPGGGGAAAALAQRAPESVAAVVARVMPSVVTVHGDARQGESIGSGFVIAAEGYILTNDHVIADIPDDGVSITLPDSSALAARVVGRDPEADLAVLKVDRDGLRAAEFGDSDAVAIGDPVLAIGSPLALSGTVTFGIVSALDRTVETGEGTQARYYAAIQTDAAVNRGNSGGPLFDLAGRVIGINSVIKTVAEDQEVAGNIGIAFAIPINQARRVAGEIIDTGRARRTVIGAQLDNNRTPGGGVRLAAIDEGGPAADAGLRPGDVITRLGGHPIEAPRDLIALVRRYDPGTVVSVQYRRGTASQSAQVTLVADAN
jgi:putative serine protease PepD